MKAERTLRSRTVFRGKLLEVRVLEIAAAHGGTSRREIVSHGGAVAALAIRPDGKLVLVRQYRKALERVTLEVVAGGMNPGEKPAACARREVREETGYRVRRLRRLGRIYPAPGYCTEALHIFVAFLDGAQGDQDPDEDEQVAPAVLRPAQFEALIRAGKVEDAKTLAAWMLYLRRPSSVRSSPARR